MAEIIDTNMDPKSAELVGRIAQFMLDDMAANADLRVKLSKDIGYSDGYKVGYADGYADARQELGNQLRHLAYFAGLVPQEVQE